MQTFSSDRLELPGNTRQEIKSLLPGRILAVSTKASGSVGVVQTQNGSLGMPIGPAVVVFLAVGCWLVRVLGISLDLDRPAFVCPDDQWHGTISRRHGRGIVLRNTVDVSLRQPRKGNDCFHGPSATREPNSSKETRGGHYFYKMPPRDNVIHSTQTVRHINVPQGAGLVRIRCTRVPPPRSIAVVGYASGLGPVHRWHAEQYEDALTSHWATNLRPSASCVVALIGFQSRL